MEDFNLAIVRPPIQTKGIIFFFIHLHVKIVYDLRIVVFCAGFYSVLIILIIIQMIYTELTDNMLIIKCFETIFNTISDIWLIVFWICLALFHFYKHYQNQLLLNDRMTETTPLWNQY